jgi:Tfp pilus assembly protein FimT
MLEFIFVLDGTRGATLVLMTFMLAVFAVDVPVLLAFSVPATSRWPRRRRLLKNSPATPWPGPPAW